LNQIYTFMSNELLRSSPVVQAQLRQDIPDFKVGSIVELAYKIIEGGKERIQNFKGIVTNRHNLTDMNATFTVMKNSTFNTKVERTFPVNSPLIQSIKVLTLRRARRANIRMQMHVKDPNVIRSRAVVSNTPVEVAPVKKSKKSNPKAVEVAETPVAEPTTQN
jgi:large subunit ribosomal protein L19